MDEEIIIFMAMVVLVFIPALAITARFTLNPLVDAILRLREGLGGNAVRPQPEAEERLRRIEADLAEVRVLLAEVAEKSRFDRELGTGRREAALPMGDPGKPAAD